jgi:hypothetical protein
MEIVMAGSIHLPDSGIRLDSASDSDDTSQNSQGVLECNVDSDASTTCSPVLTFASKKRLPVDFGFLSDENANQPSQKCRRITIPHKATGRHLQICGPEAIQTLRGRMFGREIALVLCGEAHEDTIDLTRRKGDLHAFLGWCVTPCPANFGFDFGLALGTKRNVTLQSAKKWAQILLREEDEKDRPTEGASLVYASSGRTKGTATLFPPQAKRSAEFPPLRGCMVFEWDDKDKQARDFNKRRLVAPVSTYEHDVLIAERKAERLVDGFELFDDWLIRQVGSSSAHVEFIQEAPVSAEEVELHVEPSVDPAPPAHERLRLMDLDSDEDDDDEPHLGGGCYLDYLRRQTFIHMPKECVHAVDPRVLGDAEDENLPEFLHGSFQASRFTGTGAAPADREMDELDSLGAK